jgi:predicted RNA-binding Zn ribbon-like protein
MADHYVVVDGLRQPAPLGGDPALDFCNTWVGWGGGVGSDYLQSYDHLAVWAGESGLVDRAELQSLRDHARKDPAAADAALERAKRTRRCLYGGLTDPFDGNAFAQVAAEVNAAAAAVRLVIVGETVQWQIDDATGLDRPRLAVAWAAGQLIVSPERSRIRVCPGHDCGWLFLDRSGRRRWCTMSTCGNRAKVKRFAERQRHACSTVGEAPEL